MQVSYSVIGSDELIATLKDFEQRVQNSIMRQVVENGATPLNQLLKSHARSIKLTGLLAKSIGKRGKSYPNASVGRVYVQVVGARVGFRAPYNSKKRNRKKYPRYGGKAKKGRRRGSGFVDPAKYFRFVEFGTKFARPVPIFETAIAAARSDMEFKMADTARRLIEREAEAAASRNRRIASTSFQAFA